VTICFTRYETTWIRLHARFIGRLNGAVPSNPFTCWRCTPPIQAWLRAGQAGAHDPLKALSHTTRDISSHMFDPMIHSSDGIVLPALEAAYMVTAVKEAEDGTAQLCPSQADSPSTPSYLSAPLPRHIHNSSWRAGRILSWFVPPLLGLFILYGWQFASRFVSEPYPRHNKGGLYS
jgi:hypothetical protein